MQGQHLLLREDDGGGHVLVPGIQRHLGHHDCQCRIKGEDDQLLHGPPAFQLGITHIHPAGLDDRENLLYQPSQPVPSDYPHGVLDAADLMGGQQLPLHGGHPIGGGSRDLPRVDTRHGERFGTTAGTPPRAPDLEPLPSQLHQRGPCSLDCSNGLFLLL